MSQPEVTIIVAGQAGTGKTIISEIIKQALACHGVDAQVNDIDLGENPDCPKDKVRDGMKTLAAKGLKVTINQQQLVRGVKGNISV